MLFFSQKTGELSCILLDEGHLTNVRTAMGSDTPEKIELDPQILKNADILVADSLSQYLSRGEIQPNNPG